MALVSAAHLWLRDPYETQKRKTVENGLILSAYFGGMIKNIKVFPDFTKHTIQFCSM